MQWIIVIALGVYSGFGFGNFPTEQACETARARLLATSLVDSTGRSFRLAADETLCMRIK